MASPCGSRQGRDLAAIQADRLAGASGARVLRRRDKRSGAGWHAAATTPSSELVMS